MLQARVKRAFASAAICMASALGFAGSAQAAVYAGDWDPAFGYPFADLGWKGSATFFIPDACLGGSGWIDNSSACSQGAMEILSAKVDFYSVSAGPSTILETLIFDAVTPYVNEMEVSGGKLTGVSSDYSWPVQAFSSIAGGGDYYFELAFQKDDSFGAKGASLFFSRDPYGSCGFESSGPVCGYSADTGAVTYTLVSVPEPQTYALMLAGLMAIVFMTRRRN